MEDDYFCPLPMKWNAIYDSLLRVWEEEGRIPANKPPVPLILAAWHSTSGIMKLLRWKETLEWAQRHGCAEMVELGEKDKFRE